MIQVEHAIVKRLIKSITLLFIALAILTWCEIANSAEIEFAVGVYTKHLNDSVELNEDNNLLAIKYDGMIGLTAINSHERLTFFFGDNILKYIPKYSHFEYNLVDIDINLYTGLLYGYGDYILNWGGITPGLFPSIEVGPKDGISAEAVLMPSTDKGVFILIFNIPIK